MQITPASLDAIFYNFRLGFQDAYERGPSWWDKVAMLQPSSQRENRYPWMKLIPRLREWVGERVLNNLVARGYTIINKDFEGSIQIDRNDILDDAIGVYAGAVAMLGDQAKRWPDDRITVAMQSGVTTTCFDGQPFFNDSHPIDIDVPSLGTYSNNFVGTELNAANYQTVRSAMMSYKGEDNKPLAITPKLLVVPPQLEAAGRQILNADFIAPAAGFGINGTGQQTNVLKGSADILVVPELANEPTTWYLSDNTKPVKALVWQLRQPPVLQSLVNPTDVNVFMGRKFIYGVDARGNHGYSLPFLMARCIA